MNNEYPSRLLERAVKELSKLPGIGRRTALRLLLHQLRLPAADTHALAESLHELVDNIKYCKVCHNISDSDICEICSNPARDTSTICVVENIRGVMSVEATGIYHGLYHVLGGIISPIDGIGPSQLEIASLVERVAKGGVLEIILALSPTMEGDTTNFYISRQLENMNVKITTLARGISVGDDLEFADEVTLGRSLENRIELK